MRYFSASSNNDKERVTDEDTAAKDDDDVKWGENFLSKFGGDAGYCAVVGAAVVADAS